MGVRRAVSVRVNERRLLHVLMFEPPHTAAPNPAPLIGAISWPSYRTPMEGAGRGDVGEPGGALGRRLFRGRA